MNRHGEAESLHRKALAIRRKLLGNEHPDVATSMDRLAIALGGQGKLEEAERIHREALAMRRKLLGNAHPDLAHTLFNLGWVLKDRRKLAESESMFREALEIRIKVLGPGHSDTDDALDALTIHSLLPQGKNEEAETLHRELLAKWKASSGDAHPGVLVALTGLTRLLLAERRYLPAEPPARELLAFCQDNYPDCWETFYAQSALGDCLRGQKKYAEAEPLLLSGYEGMNQHRATIPSTRLGRLDEALRRVVKLYEATGQTDKVTEWKTKQRGGAEKARASKNPATPKP
jgi:tetratricopeptide (TPR) repeat protein